MSLLCRDVIAVGASAGGVEALRILMSTLPADLDATVLVVLHMPTGGTSALSSILDRAGPLPVAMAHDGDPLDRRQVYTAPPDHHLLVVDDTLRLSRGPTENGYRPAVDALFRSAAREMGPRAIGVVLSGALDDGTAGLMSIVARGGVAVVQEPSDALYPGMPESALREVKTDHVVPVADMAAVLATLVREPVNTDNTPSGFSCPDCQGSLLALEETDRYRCRVGHAWTAEALHAEKSAELERALWTALRTLDEKTSLSLRMRAGALERGSPGVAARYGDSAEESEHAAEILRAFLRSGDVERS